MRSCRQPRLADLGRTVEEEVLKTFSLAIDLSRATRKLTFIRLARHKEAWKIAL